MASRITGEETRIFPRDPSTHPFPFCRPGSKGRRTRSSPASRRNRYRRTPRTGHPAWQPPFLSERTGMFVRALPKIRRSSLGLLSLYLPSPGFVKEDEWAECGILSESGTLFWNPTCTVHRIVESGSGFHPEGGDMSGSSRMQESWPLSEPPILGTALPSGMHALVIHRDRYGPPSEALRFEQVPLARL